METPFQRLCRELTAELGSEYAAAQHMGISRSVVHKALHGDKRQRSVQRQVAARIATRLGFHVDYFLRNPDSKPCSAFRGQITHFAWSQAPATRKAPPAEVVRWIKEALARQEAVDPAHWSYASLLSEVRAALHDSGIPTMLRVLDQAHTASAEDLARALELAAVILASVKRS
ncbi:MAG: hypothetical protein ACPGUV_00345 [Polyangiales bacterium]